MACLRMFGDLVHRRVLGRRHTFCFVRVSGGRYEGETAPPRFQTGDKLGCR